MGTAKNIIIGYNSCTLECSKLAICSLSSSLSSLLGFCGQREHQTTKFDNLVCPARLNFFYFLSFENFVESRKGKVIDDLKRKTGVFPGRGFQGFRNPPLTPRNLSPSFQRVSSNIIHFDNDRFFTFRILFSVG